MNASGTNLSKTIAGVMTSAEPGSYGPLLRGLLVAITARRNYVNSSSRRLQILSELVENAAVYAERNDL